MTERVLSSLLGTALLLSLAVPRNAGDELVTKRLVIVDDQGRQRIVAECGAAPRLLFKSETGQDAIRLGIGDEEEFPFAPHLTLQTGQTSLRLSVTPVGKNEGPHMESAGISMNSFQDDRGKFLNVVIFPDQAEMGIATFDPKNPAAIMGAPGVGFSVDKEGAVTTRLGSEHTK